MGFSKPPMERWVRLGDGEKQERRVVGVLVDIEVGEDRGYGAQYVYSIMQGDGTIAKVNGKASFDRAIKAKHVGQIIQLEWLGKATSKAGFVYDNIEFSVFSAANKEEADEYRAVYPLWGMFSLDTKPVLPPRREEEPSYASVTEHAEDDELPF